MSGDQKHIISPSSPLYWNYYKIKSFKQIHIKYSSNGCCCGLSPLFVHEEVVKMISLWMLMKMVNDEFTMVITNTVDARVSMTEFH